MFEFLLALVSACGTTTTLRALDRLGWSHEPNPWDESTPNVSIRVKWAPTGVAGIAVVRYLDDAPATAAILPGSDPQWAEVASAIESREYISWRHHARAFC